MFLTDDGLQYHVRLKQGDIGEYVFLPGDPFRTDIIASYLDDAVLVAHNREHKTWTGYLDGVTGVYQTPGGYYVDDRDVEEFDSSFPVKEKLVLPGQIFK